MILNNNTRLSEIQNEISGSFPFLKAEFFNVTIALEKRNLIKEMIKEMIKDTQKKIGDIHHLMHPMEFSINGNQKVSTIEKNFMKNFGINPQIFRKSGGAWLMTTTSDSSTLSDQNKKGLEMNTELSDEINEDFELYHEQL